METNKQLDIKTRVSIIWSKGTFLTSVLLDSCSLCSSGHIFSFKSWKPKKYRNAISKSSDSRVGFLLALFDLLVFLNSDDTKNTKNYCFL